MIEHTLARGLGIGVRQRISASNSIMSMGQSNAVIRYPVFRSLGPRMLLCSASLDYVTTHAAMFCSCCEVSWSSKRVVAAGPRIEVLSVRRKHSETTASWGSSGASGQMGLNRLTCQCRSIRLSWYILQQSQGGGYITSLNVGSRSSPQPMCWSCFPLDLSLLILATHNTLNNMLLDVSCPVPREACKKAWLTETSHQQEGRG